MKRQFQEKYGTSHSEISVSYTTFECDNVTTLYYPVSTLSSVKWPLKAEENVKLLALKVIAVASRGDRLQKVTNIVI